MPAQNFGNTNSTHRSHALRRAACLTLHVWGRARERAPQAAAPPARPLVAKGSWGYYEAIGERAVHVLARKGETREHLAATRPDCSFARIQQACQTPQARGLGAPSARRETKRHSRGQPEDVEAPLGHALKPCGAAEPTEGRLGEPPA